MQPDPTPIVLPDVSDLQAQGTEITTLATSYSIETQEQCVAAAMFLRRLARYKDDVVARFSSIKKQADALHKSITAAEKEQLAPALAAAAIVKRALSDFQIEQDRKRRVEQSRLQAEQRARDEAARDAEAENLDKAGDTDAAIALLERPIATVAVQIEAPKTEGVSFRSAFKFEVIDESRVDVRFKSPDQKKIQQVVDGMKNEAAAIVGGIRVWEEKVSVVRR